MSAFGWFHAILVLATAGFDPAVPAKRMTGIETHTHDGKIRLWSAVERLEDPGPMFAQEDFNPVTAWLAESQYQPWIDDAFGTTTPSSNTALLHMSLGEETAMGTPVLFVPGASDNGPRATVFLGRDMDALGRPFYALTFAHPHGDLFMQAEMVANAVARIRARTGAEQVDIVGHSKGGIAAAIYLANEAGVDWGNALYETHGTAYRDDVRKAVFVATPLGGIDAAFRWPGNNLLSTAPDKALSPSSWSKYYPAGTQTFWWAVDMRAQDVWSGGQRDLFPGQRQLLVRQPHPLPGSLPWLGAYAAQPDWYTTYNGGYGFMSYSHGIDAAIADGGHLIARLGAQGIDPNVDIYLLAGSSPLLPNATQEYLTEMFGAVWVDMMTAGTDRWATLLARVIGHLGVFGITQADFQGLLQGRFILGDITGPSDGLVFVDSATKASTLTARGAEVVDEYVADLSHLDLLLASPATGEAMLEQAKDDPIEHGWMAGLGERYISEDTLGWLVYALSD